MNPTKKAVCVFSKRGAKKGFTLVELLIVIIIIGILAAAAMLGSGGAQDSAQAASIVSELRNIKSAVSLYVAKYPNSSDVEFNTAFNKKVSLIADNMDNSAKFSAAGNPYIIHIGTTDADKKWYVGCEVPTLGVKAKLKDMASNIGLVGAADADTAPTYPYTNEKYVLLTVR